MTRLYSCLRRALGTFVRRESGSLTVESALLAPMLVWSVVMTYGYFDGFRESTANLKAAFTVSDLISREAENEITDTYASSMYVIFNRMVRDNTPLKMRLSLVRYNAEDDLHIVEWSTHCGFTGTWNNGNVKPLADTLPAMADLDTLIVVETSKDYDPPINTDWLASPHKFDNVVFTRPRFVPTIKANVSDRFCQQDVVGVAPGA
ncbi:TadE/TadG family type IV pilus assembly protein [Ruegeria atlantica]|uniref:TadE/TadG family type IV pilus assembly protein n=1 Tax=Ruegeria atlantica TaxID=81569 RepID=UPI002495A3D1|nr:hypothetical protein [Ruegeria atlantica]